MIFNSPSLCPYLYESLSVVLYNLDSCLKMLFLRPRPMAPEYQHWYATRHTVADDHEFVFMVPCRSPFELAEFAAIFHGAMRIAFLFI